MRLIDDAPTCACATIAPTSGSDRDRMLVGCGGNTILEFVEVQMEGKKRMPAAEFLRGFQISGGERLGA